MLVVPFPCWRLLNVSEILAPIVGLKVLDRKNVFSPALLDSTTLLKYKFGFVENTPVSANGLPCLFRWVPKATTPACANVDNGV